ncbi:MAG TPA: tetratricopeptide repeat protein [Labilithrix sp.]|nr:tetratricopeptide repeat protein [Labilithrix sp.]
MARATRSLSLGSPGRAALAAILIAACVATSTPASASSALELVRAARAHEAAKEEDLAVRRYMEALALDPTCDEAYLGLGSLRSRQGDLREAERVYSLAIEHLPGLRAARLGRAYVRRALGARTEAVDDLLMGGDEDPAAMRILAGWYGEEGQTPAQLAVWRRIAARAEATADAVLLHEAKTTIRALLILVGPADPAATPATEDRGVRRLVATLARRGG